MSEWNPNLAGVWIFTNMLQTIRLTETEDGRLANNLLINFREKYSMPSNRSC